MDLQHITAKLFVSTNDLDLGALIPVYHRWIQKKSLPGMLIDVADYAHVPQGPGVMLIAQEGHWAFDQGAVEGEGKPGVSFANKRLASGSTRERLADAIRRALTATQLMLDESTLAGKITTSCEQWVLRFDDHLHTPNTAESLDALRSDIDAVFAELYGQSATLTHLSDVNAGLTVRVEANATTVAELLSRCAVSA